MNARPHEPKAAPGARILPFRSARRPAPAGSAARAPRRWLRRAVSDDTPVELPDDLVRAVLQAWRASA